MDVMHYLEDNIADALYCYKGIVNYIIAALSFQVYNTFWNWIRYWIDEKTMRFLQIIIDSQLNACLP